LARTARERSVIAVALERDEPPVRLELDVSIDLAA
jgi:hypothetical protein